MKYSAPNLRHMRALSAVAECKTISAASSEVFLSQPAITQAINNVEKQQGVILFERRPDGMYLTDAGHLFIDRINRMLRHLRTGAQKASDHLGKRGGKELDSLEQLITGVQIRALIALSEINNYSLAAKSICISQPSLHRAAKDLEHICATQLFTKESRGIGLSETAKILAFYFRLALSELDQGIDELAAWQGKDSSVITIGTMPLARTYILPHALNKLLKDKPNIHIKVEDGPYTALLQGLRNGKLDLLIGALRNPLPIEDVKQEFLFDDELHIIGRKDHPLMKLGKVSRKDLNNHSWVVPRAGTPTRDFFDNLFTEDEVINTIESSSLILIRELLVSSDRLTIISKHQVHNELETDILERIDFPLVSTNRPIGISTRKDWRPTATQAKLMNNVRQVSLEINHD